jgi:hypothetical protein
MIESVICGCIPFVPNKLSYEELYPPEFRFIDEGHCEHRLTQLIQDKHYHNIASMLSDQLAIKFIQQGREAIPNMLEIMEGL